MESLKKKIEGWSLGNIIKTNLATKDPTQVPMTQPRQSTDTPTERNTAHHSIETPKPEFTRSPSYYSIKSKLHQILITQIDLVTAESIPKDQLRIQLSSLVEKNINEQAFPVNEAERNLLITDLENEIMGLGPLEPLLADQNISEIMVNSHSVIFVEKKGRIELVPDRFNDDDHLLKIIDKIVTRVGRRIDDSSPMVDARLADGSRVNAIIPPIALDGPALSIRRFAVVPFKIA